MDDLWSNSRIENWYKCEQLNVYTYINRKVGGMDRKMWLGTLIHENLEKIYDYFIRFNEGKVTQVPRDILMGICIPIPGECDRFEYELRGQAAQIAIDYHDQYMPTVDKNLRILAVEEKIILPLTTPKGRTIQFVQYIDLVYYNEVLGETWIMDHKSGRLWTAKEANRQGQQAIYLANLRALDRPIIGAVINNLSSTITKAYKPPHERFQRHTIRKDDTEIAGIMANTLRVIDRMIDGAENPVMHLSTSCAYCPFDDVCQLKLKGRHKDAEIALSMMPDKGDSHAARLADRDDLAERIRNRSRLFEQESTPEPEGPDWLDLVDDDDDDISYIQPSNNADLISIRHEDMLGF